MGIISYTPFCPYSGRWVSLRYLSAGLRYTTPLGLIRERLCSSLRQRLKGSRVQLEEPAPLCLLVRQHTRGRRRRLGREPGAEQREQDRHTRAECESQDE